VWTRQSLESQPMVAITREKCCPSSELNPSNPEKAVEVMDGLWGDWVLSNGSMDMLRIFITSRVPDPDEESRSSLRKQRFLPRTRFICGPSPQKPCR